MDVSTNFQADRIALGWHLAFANRYEAAGREFSSLPLAAVNRQFTTALAGTRSGDDTAPASALRAVNLWAERRIRNLQCEPLSATVFLAALLHVGDEFGDAETQRIIDAAGELS